MSESLLEIEEIEHQGVGADRARLLGHDGGQVGRGAEMRPAQHLLHHRADEAVDLRDREVVHLAVKHPSTRWRGPIGRLRDRSGRARPRDASALTGQYPSVRPRRESTRVQRSLDWTDRVQVALDDVVDVEAAAAPKHGTDVTWRVAIAVVRHARRRRRLGASATQRGRTHGRERIEATPQDARADGDSTGTMATGPPPPSSWAS
jgi:hypothetical protein